MGSDTCETGRSESVATESSYRSYAVRYVTWPYHRDLNVTFSAVGQPFSRGWLSVVAASVGGMDSSSFPATAQVRQTHPGELAVLLSTLSPDAVAAMSGAQAESVVVATQRVASWAHGLQAVAVDRFAEHVLDDQEAHATELVAVRDAQRAQVEASGGTWRGGSGAVVAARTGAGRGEHAGAAAPDQPAHHAHPPDPGPGRDGAAEDTVVGAGGGAGTVAGRRRRGRLARRHGRAAGRAGGAAVRRGRHRPAQAPPGRAGPPGRRQGRPRRCHARCAARPAAPVACGSRPRRRLG